MLKEKIREGKECEARKKMEGKERKEKKRWNNEKSISEGSIWTEFI